MYRKLWRVRGLRTDIIVLHLYNTRSAHNNAGAHNDNWAAHNNNPGSDYNRNRGAHNHWGAHNNNRAAYNDTLEWVSINSFSILGLYKFILHLDLYRVPTERELWLNIILFQGSSVIIELFHSYILIETAFRIKILDSICRFSL